MTRLSYLKSTGEPSPVAVLVVLLVCVAAFSFVLGMFTAALIVGGV